MTRKQALELAVQTLAGNKEAVQVLHTMIDELPLNRWTEAAIRDSVEQFILDNGRPPPADRLQEKVPPAPLRYQAPLRPHPAGVAGSELPDPKDTAG